MTGTQEPTRGRLNGSGPLAVVDIGSNSVRIVVYEREARTPTMLFNEKTLAGLGRGVAATGELAEDSVAKALNALKRYRALSEHIGVKKTYVVATAAVRDATNGSKFVRDVEEVIGAPVRILDGGEEAHYSALGIVAGFWKPRGIVGDLGGGSLELVEVSDKVVGDGETFPLGGLRLSEDADGKISKAQKIVEESLRSFKWPAMNDGERTFFAVGGTWRSLGRLHLVQNGYPLHVMHNYEISGEEALAFCQSVQVKDLEGVNNADCISKQRRSLVPFGAVVMEQVLKSMKADRVVFSATGVREGLLHEYLPEELQEQDPVIEAARELSLLRARSPQHGEELIAWTDAIFDEMSVTETGYERRLRHAACLLADIGWRAHPDYRGEQSFNIISNAAFVGLDHAGRAYLAAAVFYRHQGLGEGNLSNVIRALFTERLKVRAKILGAVLRVASLLSASMAGTLALTTIRKDDCDLVLELPSNLEAFEGERLRKRLMQLAKVLRLENARTEIVD